MASFFQPPTGDDPTIVACNGSSAYQVYCNSVVPASERIAGAWQYFNLAVIGVGSGLPLLVLVVKGLMSLARIWKDRARYVYRSLILAKRGKLIQGF